MAINNSINTLNLPLDITSGTGTISIANEAFIIDNLTIGNSGGITAVTFNSGTGGMNIGTAGNGCSNIIFGNLTAGASIINIDSGTGPINIGTNAVAHTYGFSLGKLNVYTGTGGVKYPSSNITAASQAMNSGVYYTANRATLVTFTLNNFQGRFQRIAGNGAGGWKITQSANFVIHSTAASTTVGVTGTLSSGGVYDSVELLCVADNTWVIISFKGTLVFV